MLAALFVATMTTGIALINNQVHLFTQLLNWPIAIAGIVLLVVASLHYRCTGCGKFPESDDVPLFNPKVCCHCGQTLK